MLQGRLPGTRLIVVLPDELQAILARSKASPCLGQLPLACGMPAGARPPPADERLPLDEPPLVFTGQEVTPAPAGFRGELQ